MTQFRQLTSAMQQRQLLDSAPRRLEGAVVTEMSAVDGVVQGGGRLGFTYQDDGFDLEVIDVVAEPVPPGLT